MTLGNETQSEGYRAYIGLLFKQTLGNQPMLKAIGFKNSGKKEQNKQFALFMIKLAKQLGKDPYTHPNFKQCLKTAAADGDEDFFNSIYRAMKNPKVDIEEIARQVTKLEAFLCMFWDGKWRKSSYPLNLFERESLAVICTAKTGQELTADAVEKTRQRLGLNPAPSKKLKVIEKDGRLVVLRPDKFP